jgi:polyisoprenoid-binding protein YceI
MKHHLTMLLTLFAVASLTTANVSRQLEPQSYIEYQVSHGGIRFTGRAPVETVDLSTKDEGLELQVVINPARFDSNNLVRDGLASATVFETKRYPRIVFTAFSDLTIVDAEQIELEGTLFMHGVANEVRIPVRLEHEDDTITATGTLAVKLSDYHMQRPQVGKLLIDEEIRITFSFNTTLDNVTL